MFSNDLKWAKNWLETRYRKPGEEELSEQFCIIEETTEHTGFLDMMLMSKCKHNIIANSSFSWWASWINNYDEKCIIAPDKWFNNQECKDIHTSKMIRISADGRMV